MYLFFVLSLYPDVFCHTDDERFTLYFDRDIVDYVIGSIDFDRWFPGGLGVDDVYGRTGRYGIEFTCCNVFGFVFLTGRYCFMIGPI